MDRGAETARAEGEQLEAAAVVARADVRDDPHPDLVGVVAAHHKGRRRGRHDGHGAGPLKDVGEAHDHVDDDVLRADGDGLHAVVPRRDRDGSQRVVRRVANVGAIGQAVTLDVVLDARELRARGASANVGHGDDPRVRHAVALRGANGNDGDAAGR